MENSHLWNVEMEPRMGDGENKLNQWKVWKTESMENLHLWILSAERSPHKCPCINVLNVEMAPRMSDLENCINGKFGKLNQWKISGF